MSSAVLQELVEDRAGRLQAPAVIEDDKLRMVAYSTHDMLIDIRRETAAAAHADRHVAS